MTLCTAAAVGVDVASDTAAPIVSGPCAKVGFVEV